MSGGHTSEPGASGPRIEARGLRVEYAGARGRRVLAVDDVSLAVGAGETLALVGESGSGKTTTGRAILRLVPASAGSVSYRRADDAAPVDVLALGARALRELRREIGIVLQDPLASLDPRRTAGEAVAEGLLVHRIARGEAARVRVGELLERVGLARAAEESFPHELSGGERQRVAIARALAVGPRFLVLDEPVSALDASVRAQVADLLDGLQRERGLSYLLIAHDLGLVRGSAHRVAVMSGGRIVETGTVEAVFRAPEHPATRALLAAAPRLEARAV